MRPEYKRQTMDPELQAIREARLAELKRNTNGDPSSNGSDATGSGGSNNANIGSMIAGHLQPQALERLSRVSLVRPDRAKAVEQYLIKLINQGAVTHKVTEDEIVQILHGVAREQNKKNETKIIFDRREMTINDEGLAPKQNDDDDEDDFFD